MSFRDLPTLGAALESGDWDLAIRWHQAGADIDSAAIADRLRQAITAAADADTVARSHHAGAGVPVTPDPDRPMVSPPSD
jgi:hypothetical protein